MRRSLPMDDKPGTNRKRLSGLRVAVVIAGIVCIIHLGHRECARTTERPVNSGDFETTAIESAPSVDSSKEFHATAYCITGATRSGALTAPGIVAADPKVIPLGSMIYVESPLMGGIYHVLDTGELVKGKIIDIFIPNYEQCVEFGRRIVKVKVLRYGFWGRHAEDNLGK
jgi:3D (Asp-Asp-Asp) domain-containing protein